MGKHDDLIGGSTAKEQLNLIYVLDTSGSMCGEPINQLNIAMGEAIQAAEEAALEMELSLAMRVIEFNSGARWLYGDEQTGLSHIDWKPLSAKGGTDTAGALRLAGSMMHRDILGVRNFKPVVILITDGESNDPAATKKAAAELRNALRSSTDPNKDKIMRIAIGVQGYNRSELETFASRGTIQHADGTADENVPLVFPVDDIHVLKSLLRTLTTSSIASSVGGDRAGGEVVIPDSAEDEDEWIE